MRYKKVADCQAVGFCGSTLLVSV